MSDDPVPSVRRHARMTFTASAEAISMILDALYVRTAEVERALYAAEDQLAETKEALARRTDQIDELHARIAELQSDRAHKPGGKEKRE